MEELVKMVSQKAGISADQATKAIGAVMDFLKTKLPAPIAAQVQGLLEGGTNKASDVMKGLGGLLGKK